MCPQTGAASRGRDVDLQPEHSRAHATDQFLTCLEMRSTAASRQDAWADDTRALGGSQARGPLPRVSPPGVLGALLLLGRDEGLKSRA
jgi:hypothetical protein